MRDLGVQLDSKMLMSTHINSAVDRAYRNLGFVIRSCAPLKCATSLKVVYFAYVRSILEYASPVWSPCYDFYIKRIERVQKKFLKHLNFKCRKVGRGTPYVDACRAYNLLTLEERRELLDMGLLFDVIHGRLDCPELVEKVLSLCAPSRRTRHTKLFSVPFHSTNYGKNAVLTRILKTFNDLYSEIDPFTGSKSVLKGKVKQNILQRMDAHRSIT